MGYTLQRVQAATVVGVVNSRHRSPHIFLDTNRTPTIMTLTITLAITTTGAPLYTDLMEYRHLLLLLLLVATSADNSQPVIMGMNLHLRPTPFLD